MDKNGKYPFKKEDIDIFRKRR